VFDLLLTAGVAGHLKAMAVRLPHLVVLLALQYVGLYGFGVKVPILQALLCLPVVLFVAVLPISFQGLGPTQGALIFFFARYAPGDSGARILAASLGSMLAGWCVQIPIGFLALRSQVGAGLKDLRGELPGTVPAAR
jgi:hypothetical protein